MKKLCLLCIVFMLIVSAIVFVGCNNNNDENESNIINFEEFSLELKDFEVVLEKRDAYGTTYLFKGKIILKNNMAKHTKLVINHFVTEFVSKDKKDDEEWKQVFPNETGIKREIKTIVDNKEVIETINVNGDMIELTPYEEVELCYSRKFVSYAQEEFQFSFEADPQKKYFYNDRGFWAHLEVNGAYYKKELADISWLLTEDFYEQHKEDWNLKGYNPYVFSGKEKSYLG